jgi:hypothetical protein
VNSPQPSSSVDLAKRRKLLRGAFSAPVILTVSTGAGATAASNMQCVRNQVTSPNPAVLPRSYAPGTSAPTSVVRVQLYTTGSGTSMKYYFRGTDIHNLAAPGKSPTWISVGQFREFYFATGLPATSNLGSLSATASSSYASVQFDANGNIITVGKHTADTMSMVSGTCWNSFRGMPL